MDPSCLAERAFGLGASGLTLAQGQCGTRPRHRARRERGGGPLVHSQHRLPGGRTADTRGHRDVERTSNAGEGRQSAIHQRSTRTARLSGPRGGYRSGGLLGCRPVRGSARSTDTAGCCTAARARGGASAARALPTLQIQDLQSSSISTAGGDGSWVGYEVIEEEGVPKLNSRDVF
jgi:hypothetical protein